MRALSICLIVSALCLPSSPQQAAQQRDDESAREVLVSLSTARDLDDRCHALTPVERKGLNLQIDALVKSLKMDDKEFIKSKMKEHPADEIKCDSAFAQMLFVTTKQLLRQK